MSILRGIKLSGSTGSAIVLRSVGHGPDGVFINCNEISAAFSGIRTEGASDAYISMVSVSDNRFVGGQYGFYDTIGVNKGFLRDNVFDGQQEAGDLSRRNGKYDDSFKSFYCFKRGVFT